MPRACTVAIVVTIAWGALAFGAVYPWAHSPLAVVMGMTGLSALVWRRGHSPDTGAFAPCLAIIAVATGLQLVPLSHDMLTQVSPATPALLARYNAAYGVLSAPGVPPDASVQTPDPPRRPLSIVPDDTRRGLVLYVALAVFTLGALRVFSATGAQSVGRAVLAFGSLLAVFGIVQEALNPVDTAIRVYGFWQPEVLGSRPFGPFINRNHFAGWMLMALPLACGSWYGVLERALRDTLGGVSGRAALLASPLGGQLIAQGFACVVMAASVLMTRSRSGIGALVLLVALLALMVLLRQASRRARYLAAAILCAILAATASWAGAGVVLGKFAQESTSLESVGGRVPIWIDTLRIVRDFPFFGTGLNTYGQAMAVYQTFERTLHFQEAHNDYLQIAAEGGLLLVIPSLAAIAVFVRHVRRRFREAPREGTTYWLRVGAGVGIIAIAAQSLVEFSLQMPGNAALFAILLAIALHQSPNLRRLS